MANKSVYTTTWGKNFLRAIGAPFNVQTDLFLRAWAQSENSAAKFNPYATTQPMPGSTKFNSIGVRNYLTWQQGVEATAITIKNGRYPNLLAALKEGKDANKMAAALKASPWGTGALTIEVLKYTPMEFPFGECYPVPPAPYTHTATKIRSGSVGADVDELLRWIAKRSGVAGYKWYSGAPVDWVKAWQKARPSLGTPDGIVGPLTYKSITGHS